MLWNKDLIGAKTSEEVVLPIARNTSGATNRMGSWLRWFPASEVAAPSSSLLTQEVGVVHEACAAISAKGRKSQLDEALSRSTEISACDASAGRYQSTLLAVDHRYLKSDLGVQSQRYGLSASTQSS